MIDFWNQFRRDRLAVYSLGFIARFLAAAISAIMLAPYDLSAQFFDGLELSATRARTRCAVRVWHRYQLVMTHFPVASLSSAT